MADTLQRIGEADIVQGVRDYSEEIEQIKSVKVAVITTADDFRKASDILGRAKFLIKAVDAKRVELKAPSLEEGKRVDSRCKAIIKPLEEFQKKMEAAMNDYGLAEARRKEEEARRRKEEEDKRLAEEQERLLKISQEEEASAKVAAENNDAQAKTEAECMSSMTLHQAIAIDEDRQRLADKQVKGTVNTLGADGAMTTTKEWTFEITEPALVPRPYCEPDESLVRKAVKSGVREIPGVRIYEKAKFTNR